MVGPNISFWYNKCTVLETAKENFPKRTFCAAFFSEPKQATSCYMSLKKCFYPLLSRLVKDRLKIQSLLWNTLLWILYFTLGSVAYKSNTKFNLKKETVKRFWVISIKWSIYDITKHCELSIWGFQLLLSANLSFLSCIDV